MEYHCYVFVIALNICFDDVPGYFNQVIVYIFFLTYNITLSLCAFTIGVLSSISIHIYANNKFC